MRSISLRLSCWGLVLLAAFVASACTFDTSGPTPPTTNNYSPCEDDRDCATLNCDDLRGFCHPPTCDDGRLNGDETGLDCGGACAPCPDDEDCRSGGDCRSLVCELGFCSPASCADGVRNQDEVDLDCGGPCVGCELHETCSDTPDCRDGLVCFEATCRIAIVVGFDAAGGVAPEPAQKSVILGEPYGALAATSRAGHTFDGWWTAPGVRTTTDTIVSIAEDHTLHARWTADTLNVTFDAQGGAGLTPGNKLVTFGEPYGTLATTSRTGYTFGGWWTGAGGTGTQILSTTVVSTASNHTLYARWTPNTYTVTFNAEGGSAPNPATKVVTFGLTYGTLATTSRTGYTFGGWWTGSGGTGTQILSTTVVSTASNHTLYARWTANTYTVTFDAEGGTAPNPATKSVTFGIAYGALATTSKTGATFAGWWTLAGGTGTEVTASTIVSATSNHTLYAKWE